MFDKVLNLPLQPLMIFAKRFILDVWEGSEHASAICTTLGIRRLQIRGIGNLFTKLA